MTNPTTDPDFCDIVISALRYALPRHSFMPWTTRSYMERHWEALAPKHWCILRDIREYVDEEHRIFPPEYIDLHDLNAWVDWYNKMIEHPETKLHQYHLYLEKPIKRFPEND